MTAETQTYFTAWDRQSPRHNWILLVRTFDRAHLQRVIDWQIKNTEKFRQTHPEFQIAWRTHVTQNYQADQRACDGSLPRNAAMDEIVLGKV